MARTKSMYLRSLCVLLCIISVAGFFGFRLFGMQVLDYDYYLGKVLDNLTQISVIKAERGQIYDRNMQPLAVNVTTYRVFISPADIGEEDREKICTALSDILDVDYDEVMKRALKKNRKDETIKKDVDKETADAVRSFIEENKYTRQIYLEATTKRYYPYNDLASQVIGYLGTDGGLFGLELQYNSTLTGTDGKYITARNARSQSMPSKYDVKIDPLNGSSLVTTIDVNIQAILENYLEQTYKENLAGNGACGIVMEVDTGAIRGMATVGGCDLNTPFTLTEDYANTLAEAGLDPKSDEYNELKWELIYSMWKNKCVSDTYEPGSTFKIITSAIGLETGKVTPDSIFDCTGSYRVVDTVIRCHKLGGHGVSKTFSYLLQQSCNPCMMQVAEKVGTELFWKYFTEFGYLDKTGIDLPGEASGINHTFSRFNAVELATSSFGQTFKTTPIQQLTAICAIANGGNMVTPHIVESVIDSAGNVISSGEGRNKRQIVSDTVCRELTEILAGGVVDGVARNAYVMGYRVAAKTGTSEKRDAQDKTLRVGSTVAFAPADNPRIAVLIMVDEPGGTNKSGGTVAAPYVAGVLNETLQYLGVGRVYSEGELAVLSYEMEDCVGKTVSSVLPGLEKSGLSVKVYGTGDTVYSQIPSAGEQIRVEGGRVYLYTYDAATGELPGEPEKTMLPVPNVTGYKVTAAISTLISSGFNVRVIGSLNYEAGTGAVVISQSIAAGEKAAAGTVIVIESMHTDVNDHE